MATERKSKLIDGAIYFGDNGRCFCSAHAGMTAKYTGRDISGQKIMRVSAQMIAEHGIACESCPSAETAVVS